MLVKRYGLHVAVLVAVSMISLLASVACASSEPTATPVPPTQPTQPAAPTAAPVATATLIPGAPTPATQMTRDEALPAFFEGTPKRGGTLRVAIPSSIQTLAPGFPHSYSSRPFLGAFGETLLRSYPDFAIHPLAAESWDVADDGKTITFKLREGMKFHDGTDLDAQAVVTNISWNLDPENAPVVDPLVQGATRFLSLKGFVESVEATDNLTVAFKVSRPFRPLVTFMADVQGFTMVSPEALGKLGPDFGRQPVSAGPFEFAEWIPGQHLRMARFEDYWDGNQPYLDGLTFQIVPDESVRVAMLRTEETDVLGGQGVNLLPTQLPLVENNPDIVVIPYESATVDFLMLRVTEAPFDNKALRQALAYGLNRDNIIGVIFDGHARPAYTTEGDNLWWSDPTIRPYPYDPQKAKEKLAEAGFPNGVTLPMGCSGTTSGAQQCETVQAIYEPLGIQFKVNIHENQYRDALQGNVAFHYSTGWAPREEPDTRIRTLHHSKGGNTVISQYSNPEVDRSIDEAVGIYDQAKAKELYSQAMRLAAEDAAIIPTVLRTQFGAARKEVKNIHWYGNIWFRYRDMWLER